MLNREVAIALARAGFAVFPCRGGMSVTDDEAKQPVPGMFWRNLSSTDEAQIGKWWDKWPEAIPALDLAKSKLLVVDCDQPKKAGEPSGVDWFRAFAAGHGFDPEGSPRTVSLRGGWHVFFRQPDPPLGNGRGALPPQAECRVDVRGAGGYVIAPGARLPNGRGYLAVGNLADAPVAPEWLTALLQGKPVAQEPPKAASVLAKSTSVSPSEGRVAAYAQAGIEAELSALRNAGKGERNNTLNTVSFKFGRMVASGWIGEGEAASLLEEAAAACGLVNDDGIKGVRATIRSGLQSGCRQPRELPAEVRSGPAINGAVVARNLVERDGVTVDAETGEVVEIPPTQFRWWVEPQQLPRRQWLYGHHLIRRFLSCTVAPGGLGKTFLIIAEALAMATGKPLVGDKVHERARVWLWNEDPIDELERRVQAACLFYRIDREDLKDWLFIDSARDHEIVVAHETRRDFEINRPTLDSLEASIRRRKLDVVIIDPFIKAHRINENDNMRVDAICTEMSRLADRTGVAIELVHHVRKQSNGGGDNSVEDARGATALIGAVRSARVLNRMSREEAGELGIDDAQRISLLRVDNGKANLAPPSARATWRQLVSQGLGNGSGGLLDDQDFVGVVAPWEREDPADEITNEQVRAVQDKVAVGTWRLDRRSPMWVGHPIAEILELDLQAPGVDYAVQTAFKRWVKYGFLKVVQRPDAKRMLRDFVEVGKWHEV